MSNANTIPKEFIEKTIRDLREAYWKGNPLVSDTAYDDIVEELRSIDPNNKLLTEIEHSEENSNSVVHNKPMLSLDKVYKEEALFEWVRANARNENEKFLIQPKYDGISCHLLNGVWSTRGDGYTGQNITKVCRALCNIESADDNKQDIYGEIVIKKSDFNEHYNRHVRTASGTPFKNSRNAVVGIITTDDMNFYVKQKAVLTLIDYNKNSFELTAKNFESNWSIIKQIIESLDYPMDGIVIKLADKAYSESLGCTAHHPRGQIALKFHNQSAWTELIDIDWGMGKESITATAVFKPIDLGGVTIGRAVIPMYSKTLPCVQNGDFSVGTKLLVERAGDVIPHIVQVETNLEKEPLKITECPFCHTELVSVDNKVICPSEYCTAKLVQRLYLSLVTLGIKNVGIETIKDVCDVIRYYDAISLFSWMKWFENPNFDDMILEKCSGYGVVSVDNLCKEVKKIKDTTYVKFFAALNIPNAGTAIAENIFKKYKFDDLYNITAEQLLEIEGIGNKMANRIVEFFHNNEYEIKNTIAYFNFSNKTPVYEFNNAGKSVCFTGAMRKPRKEMFDEAVKRGFNPTDNFTKSVDLLVLADCTNPTSGKCRKAKSYGIKIIRESDFLSGIYDRYIV